MDGAQKQRPTKFRPSEEWESILRAALPDFRCRACGGQDWNVTIVDDNLVGALQYSAWPSGNPAVVISSVPFVCNDCGLIEIFAEKELLGRVGKEVNE